MKDKSNESYDDELVEIYGRRTAQQQALEWRKKITKDLQQMPAFKFHKFKAPAVREIDSEMHANKMDLS